MVRYTTYENENFVGSRETHGISRVNVSKMFKDGMKRRKKVNVVCINEVWKRYVIQYENKRE